MRHTALLFMIGLVVTSRLPAAEPMLKGTIRVAPTQDQSKLPKAYRVAEHQFAYKMELKYEMPSIGVTTYRLRFPSPVKSPYEINNTVYAEYYRPKGDGPFPGVIVLDVIGGERIISRIMGTHLAQKGIAALFVQMVYYGERRPKEGKVRLISTDVPRTLAGIGQTVVDVRCATAWLEARPEIDKKRLGIVGTSLGSFIAALSAEMEPKLQRVAILLGGGGLVDAYYDDPRAAPYRKAYELLGGTKDALKKMLSDVDPLTHAANLRDRNVLMLAGKRDEVVLPKMTEALWKASGKQKIVWFDCTHVGSAAYFLPMMREIVQHFQAP